MGYDAFATIEITNLKSQTAKDLRLVLGEEAIGYKAVSVRDGKAAIKEQPWKVGRPDAIPLPDLRPGETVELRLYINYFMPLDMLRKSMLYSNLGTSGISVLGVEPDGDTPMADTFLGFIWDNIVLIIAVICIIIAGICLVSDYLGSRYIKVLLHDQDLYLKEAEKFNSDPKGFVPDFSEAGKRKLPDSNGS